MILKTKLPYSIRYLPKYQRVLLFAVLCMGIAFSLFSFTRLQDLEQNRFDTDFKRAAENRILAIQRSVNSKIDKIISLEALFSASEQVERKEFQIFAELLLKDETGTQALEWIPRVLDKEREIYEEAARQHGFSDFQITERKKQGLMIRAKKRDEYFPVYYLEPFDGNEEAMGYDLASNPVRFETLKLSRDTAEMKATPKLVLVQEQGNQPAFFVLRPVYNRTGLNNSVEERKNKFKGFVLGVFLIGNLVDEALSAIPTGIGIDIYLYDASEPDPGKRLLYNHISRTRPSKTPFLSTKDEATITQGYYYSLPVKVADRTWQLYAVPAPSFFATHKYYLRWGISGIIVIFTVSLLVYLFFMFVRAEENRRHTQALFQTKNELEVENVERKRTEKALLEKTENLREALKEIKTLRGIIPICSYCKKIRDDQGIWNQLEAYLHSHSEAEFEFSHGACPECYKKQMEDMD